MQTKKDISINKYNTEMMRYLLNMVRKAKGVKLLEGTMRNAEGEILNG